MTDDHHGRSALLFSLALCLCCDACVTPPVAPPAARLGPATRDSLDAVACEQVQELEPAYFDPQSAALTETARLRLTRNAYLLNRCSAIALHVTAYTDATAAEYRVSDELSSARAGAVRTFYAARGIRADRFLRVRGVGQAPTAGYGMDPEGDAIEDARSRRADTRPTQP